MFHLIKLLTFDSRKCFTHLIVFAVQETHLEFLFTRDIWILSLSRMSHLIGIVCCNKPQVMLSTLLSFLLSPVLHSPLFFAVSLLRSLPFPAAKLRGNQSNKKQSLFSATAARLLHCFHDSWLLMMLLRGRRWQKGWARAPPSVVVMQQLARFIDVSNSFSLCVCAKWMPFSWNDKHSQTPRQTLRQTVITLFCGGSGGKSYTSLSKFQAIYSIWLCIVLCLYLDICCTYD